MKKFKFYFTVMALALLCLSCSDSDDGPKEIPSEQNGEAQYVITATPTALSDVADYILTVSSLEDGNISLLGNGIEQDGTYRYYITNNNKFFSLLYGQGGAPGAVTTYQLNTDGNLEKLSDFQSETVQAFANVGDEVLMTKISRNSESPFAQWYRLDTETSQFVGNGELNQQELAPGTEQAFFTWMTQVGDRVFAPFMSIKSCCNDNFGTENPNQAWVAVYSYPGMTLETVISDERTSFIGRYFNNGLEADENGDAYAFSSSIANSNDEFTSSKPSAVTRIKNGEDSFDTSYFFNLEEASGGYYVTTQKYAGNGKFLVFMQPLEGKGAYTTGKRMAVVDVYSQEFTWVTGAPAETEVSYFSNNNYVSADGSTVFMGVTTQTEGSFVYSVNIALATAKRGLEVEGGNITAISRLEPAKQ